MKSLIAVVGVLLLVAGVAYAQTYPVDNFTVTAFPYRGKAVTPSDSADLPDGPGMVRANAAGAVTVVCRGNATAETITLALVAGETVPCVVRRVLDTGTDAITLHVFY